MTSSRYNFAFWQPDPEIVIFNEPGNRDTITEITEPAPAVQCGSFNNEFDKENSDYYDYNGNYYQNTNFSEWYDSNNDFWYYSIYDLPDYCATSAGGSNILPLPYLASDTTFTLSSNSAPTNFSEYAQYSFYYQPFLRVDKTIENSLGAELVVYSIDVKAYYVSQYGQFYKQSWITNTNSISIDYDTITDKYIIYPTNRLFITSDTFESILFVITYTTNSREIIKHQVVNCYDITEKYAYPLGLFNDGATHTFYLPLHNEQLKSIDATTIYEVGYDSISGLVSAKISAIALQPIFLSILHKTSKRNNADATLNIPYGNTTARCGTVNVSYGGYVGFAEYAVTTPSGTGMLEFDFVNYSIPDRFAITINSQVKYDSMNYVRHGYRAYIPITSPIIGSAGLRVYTNDPGTAWISSLGCLRDYSIYTNGLTFDFDNEFSKNDILVISLDGISYTKAKEGVHYQFHSNVSPNITRYTALTTVYVLLANERIYGSIENVIAYYDPYTSLPVHHQLMKLKYPNKTIMGNDSLNPNVGDIRITKLGLYGSFVNYTVNEPSDSQTLTKYEPLVLSPCITGNSPFTAMGSVNYVKESQMYEQVLIVRDYSDGGVYLLDPLAYLLDANGQKGMGNTSTVIPQTTPTSGYGYFFEDTSVGNTITLPYAQPFYGNTVGYKMFQTRITHDLSLPDPNSIISSYTINVNGGAYSSTISNIVVPVAGVVADIFTKYDGNTTQSINISIYDSRSEAFQHSIAIWNVVSELTSTQSFNYNSGRIIRVVKKNLSYGSNAYESAVINTDYTSSFIDPVYTITSINPIEIVERVGTNPLT